MEIRYEITVLEYVEGRSKKYYVGLVPDPSITTHSALRDFGLVGYGRIGSAGNWRFVTLDEYDELLRKKIAKGYAPLDLRTESYLSPAMTDKILDTIKAHMEALGLFLRDMRVGLTSTTLTIVSDVSTIANTDFEKPEKPKKPEKPEKPERITDFSWAGGW